MALPIRSQGLDRMEARRKVIEELEQMYVVQLTKRKRKTRN